LIAQSIAWAYAPGPRSYGEDHPLDLNAGGDRAVSVRGVESLERQVLAASLMEGLVLRYGRIYGPGSGADTPPSPPSVHVDAAAYAALLAIDHGEPGVFNIADLNDEVSTVKARAELDWRADFRWTEGSAPPKLKL
jgi:nucleoside-diphosphate-sugar epimerase